MPDLTALDFETHDAGALDGDDEVDLVVLEVVGHALARYEEIVGLELLDERLPDLALGAIGEAGCFGDGYGQARALPRSKNDCVDCTC